MSKKSQRALASATIMSLVLTSGFVVNTNNAKAAEVNRLEGAGRVQTANSVAEKAFEKAETVILVNGWGYADAVSATPLSKQLNAPILLTQNGANLEADVKAAMEKMGAKKVVIVGGTGVVSDEIKNELAANYEVSRIAGTTDTTRMGTNAAVAEEVLKTSKADTAVLVNGQDGYADALSVASVAAAKGYPVLFSKAGEVSETVKSVIEAKGLKVLAVGGKGVLSEAAVNSVKGTRIAEGADRFDTNLKVLNYFKDSLDLTNMYVAAGGRAGSTGRNDFADALVASAAAAKTGAPVVLSGLGAASAQQENAKEYIADNKKENTNVTIVGGTGSVDASVEKDIKDVVNPEDQETGDLEVSSVEALNLKQVKVNFNKAVTDSDKIDDIEDEENYTIEDKEDNELKDIVDKVEVDESGKFAIVTFKDQWENNKYKETSKTDEAIQNQEKYKLTIDESVTGTEVEKDVEFKDMEIPKIESVEAVGIDTVKVKFSEPVKPNYYDTNYKVPALDDESVEINDDSISVDRIELTNNNTEANVVLGSKLKDAQELKVKVKGTIEDYAGYGVVSEKQTVTVKIDEEKPSVVGFKNVKKGEVTLVFDKDIKFKDRDTKVLPSDDSIFENGELKEKISDDTMRASEKSIGDDFYHTNSNNPAYGVKIDGNELTMYFDEDEYPVPNGTSYMKVAAEQIETLWEVENDKISAKVERTEDTTKPEVKKVEQDEEAQNKIVVKFSEELKESTAEDKDNYTIVDEDGKEWRISGSPVYDNDDKEVTITTTKDLDKGTKYKLTVKGVEDKEGNEIEKVTKEFTIEDKESVNEGDIKVNTYNLGERDQKVIVNFDEKMKTGDDKFAADDADKYTLVASENVFDGKTKSALNIDDLYDGDVKAIDDNKKVEIKIPYKTGKDDSYKIEVVKDGDAIKKDGDNHILYNIYTDVNGKETKVGTEVTLKLQIGKVADADGNVNTKIYEKYLDGEGQVTVDTEDGDNMVKAISTDEIEVTFNDTVNFKNADVKVIAAASKEAAHEAALKIAKGEAVTGAEEISVSSWDTKTKDDNTVVTMKLDKKEDVDLDKKYDDDDHNHVLSYDGKFKDYQGVYVVIDDLDNDGEIETKNDEDAKLAPDSYEVLDKIAPTLIENNKRAEDYRFVGSNKTDGTTTITDDAVEYAQENKNAAIVLTFEEAIDNSSLSTSTFDLGDDFKNAKIDDVYAAGKQVVISLSNVENNDHEEVTIKPGFVIEQKNDFEDVNGNKVSGIDTEVGEFAKLNLSDVPASPNKAASDALVEKKAAEAVKAEIEALPVVADVTLADKTAVETARTNFDALNAVQKAIVGDIAKLTDAEAKITNLTAIDAEIEKYESEAIIAKNLAQGEDVTTLVKALKAGQTADAEINVEVTGVSGKLEDGSTEILAVNSGTVTLANVVPSTETSNGAATVTIKFTKGNATKTVDVKVTIEKQ